jgi:hypothetical protein
MGAINFYIEAGLLELLTGLLPLTAFVETGTFRGDTLEIAAKYFTERYSVEMSQALYDDASERFQGQSNLHLHLGDSPDFLREHREDFSSRAVLFWLDAHWCSADDTAGSESQSPLLDELQAIGSLHPSSVLLIDDARLYLAPPPEPHRLADWPDFHEVVLALLALSPKHRLMVYNDIVIFYPQHLRPQLSDYAHKEGEDLLRVMRDARKQRQRRKSKRWWRPS